jgi:glutathione synthase/RimK-type ligase-like ATP-grasp enzyme
VPPTPPERIELTPELEELARACGELYGVDVLVSPDGPLVVDVNEFPNYTGVEEAPVAIAELVCSRVPADVSA